jgi:hypothetical protein
MENTNKISTDEGKIQNLLEAFLVSRRSLRSSAAETSFHLDEDTLTAFSEGNLAERESMPVVSHLVDCGFCRHKTAELVRLSLDFDGLDEVAAPATVSEPHKISDVLSGLLSKIFGTADAAVFAHEEKETEKDTPDQDGEAKEEK